MKEQTRIHISTGSTEFDSNRRAQVGYPASSLAGRQINASAIQRFVEQLTVNDFSHRTDDIIIDRLNQTSKIFTCFYLTCKVFRTTS